MSCFAKKSLVHGRCSNFYTDLPPFVKAPAEAVWEPGPQACRAGSGYGSAARVEMSARYRVVAAAIVRTGAALDAPKAAVHTLRVGQEIVVTERVRLGEQVRLKFDGGWTSQTARNGSVLLELTQPEPDKNRSIAIIGIIGQPAASHSPRSRLGDAAPRSLPPCALASAASAVAPGPACGTTPPWAACCGGFCGVSSGASAAACVDTTHSTSHRQGQSER